MAILFLCITYEWCTTCFYDNLKLNDLSITFSFISIGFFSFFFFRFFLGYSMKSFILMIKRRKKWRGEEEKKNKSIRFETYNRSFTFINQRQTVHRKIHWRNLSHSFIHSYSYDAHAFILKFNHFNHLMQVKLVAQANEYRIFTNSSSNSNTIFFFYFAIELVFSPHRSL